MDIMRGLKLYALVFGSILVIGGGSDIVLFHTGHTVTSSNTSNTKLKANTNTPVSPPSDTSTAPTSSTSLSQTSPSTPTQSTTLIPAVAVPVSPDTSTSSPTVPDCSYADAQFQSLGPELSQESILIGQTNQEISNEEKSGDVDPNLSTELNNQTAAYKTTLQQYNSVKAQYPSC